MLNVIPMAKAKKERELSEEDERRRDRVFALIDTLGCETDVEISKRLGVTNAAVGQWRQTGRFSTKVLALLADYFSTTMDYLYRGIEPGKPAGVRSLGFPGWVEFKGSVRFETVPEEHQWVLANMVWPPWMPPSSRTFYRLADALDKEHPQRESRTNVSYIGSAPGPHPAMTKQALIASLKMQNQTEDFDLMAEIGLENDDEEEKITD